ncbi:HAMP domain-containing sensor histidine kinase [Desulfotruncus arcticus]|uniref:HAMP domain-containing sensor histidine kinase n=1 Tax=Desulfotruncus arcticus TaxID=341036 RepID=UPI000B8522A5|nr:HAMP domain-containing sensor histidine kinase [Desulfotruncus arcticus]
MAKKDEMHKFFQEFKRFHGRPNHHEKHQNCEHFFEKFEQHRMYHREFHRMHRSLHYFRPFALLFNLLILFLLFKLAGIKAIVIFIAALLIAKEIAQALFFLRVEKRVFRPIEALKNGVEEIARGNYDVKVECQMRNEIGLLVASFNEMARKLGESERIKSEYEENRKSLIANISHDLKTPITSIQGYIEAILDEDGIPPENKKKYLQITHHNIVYVNKLIDDLFLFAKLDLQKLNFQFEQVPVRAFMSDLTEELGLELEERQVQFLYTDKMEQDLPVSLDRKRMHQALRNIVGNALKYGPEKGLVIKAELSKQGDLACLKLSDNGPGIPADKLPHIFDRFYRIDKERTKDLMSTGLGLAIARELVEAHRGSITACSEEGKGTCFTITLHFAE